MKKLFQQIDDLCVTASIAGICSALKIERVPELYRAGFIGIRLGHWHHVLPDMTNHLWRRKWRKFLTDHVDDVAKNLDEVAAAARDGQSGSAA